MIELQTITTIFLIVSGILVMFTGSLGIVRLPEFYSKTHAVSMSDTLGTMLIFAGLIIYEGLTMTSLKLAMVVLFIALSNPVGTHALARAAYKRGFLPTLTGEDTSQSHQQKEV